MKTDFFEIAHLLNQQHQKLLLNAKTHFRGSENSISLISLSEGKPELGISCKRIKNKKDTKIPGLIEHYIEQISKKPNPGRRTPEKELQAWIILYTMNNNNSLPFEPGIKFITSELAIKNNAGEKVVTDILGYDERSHQLCVIELKTDRLLKRLIKQVESFEMVINEKHTFFSELLQIHGYPNIKLQAGNIQKIIVWPHENTSPKAELKKSNINEYTFLKSYTFCKQSE